VQTRMDLRIVRTLDNALKTNDLRRSGLRRSMGRRTLTCVRPILQVSHPPPTSGAGWIVSPGRSHRFPVGCRTVGQFWYHIATSFDCISEVQSCPPDCLNVETVAVSMVTSHGRAILPRGSSCLCCYTVRCAAAIVTGVPTNQYLFQCDHGGNTKRRKVRRPDA